MILVIGGAHQGKYEYIKNRFSFIEEDVFYGDSSSYEMLKQKKVIKDFHLLVKRFLQDELPILEEIESLLESSEENSKESSLENSLENSKESSLEKSKESSKELIIISDEIGCGIVPMDRFERRYREETGRICCYLAQRAKEVIRVHCGIATVIQSSKETG